MSQQGKISKPGFVIKLSTETAHKLAVEDQNAKIVTESQISSEAEGDKTKMIVNTSDGLDTEIVAPKSISDDTNKDTADSSQVSTQWGDYAPYIIYEGDEALYTDPSTQQKYIWDKSSNSWTPKPGESVPGREYSYEDDTHIYTDPDGSKYFYDVDKKAWIPKVDDDFLAIYQMSYGFVDNTVKEEKSEASKSVEDKMQEQQTGVKRKNEPQWFEASNENNTKVYVSNLPLEMTEEEFVDFMQKCGLVMRDPQTQKMKVKLYQDKDHKCFKGDALCTYIKIESVDLALKLLDGSDFKGNKIKVERAHFQLKGDYNPALKPKKKKKKELDKLKKMQEKLFDWRPEKFIGERSKHERVVIIKNLFTPTDFDNEVQLILDYQQDLREECSKCGEVRKVVLYDRHPEGVAQVTMKEPEQADAVVTLTNGRWFGKRQLTAEIWDGRTKYRIGETDADISKRINKWDKFLEGEDGKKEKSDASVGQDKEKSDASVGQDKEKSDACDGQDKEKSGASDGQHKDNSGASDGQDKEKSESSTNRDEGPTENSDISEAHDIPRMNKALDSVIEASEC